MKSDGARSFGAIALSIGVAASALAVSPPASAFCRTTTVAISAEFDPDAGVCWTEGSPLYWKNACVGYSLQRDASRQVALEDASQAITRAFTKWTGTACPTDGTGTSRTSIDVRDIGPVSCDLVQYNQDQGNQHVIVFRDDTWPHNDVNNALALTTVTFNPDTGEIYDADMEINTHDQHVTLTDPIPADGFDFASIVTHETGHFLGMAHSGDKRATMYAHYNQGAVAMRNLTSDDVNGICAVYSPDGSRNSASGPIAEDACDPTPRHGFSTECGTPQKKSCIPGLAIGATDRSNGASDTRITCLAALAIAGALSVRRRMRRGARRLQKH